MARKYLYITICLAVIITLISTIIYNYNFNKDNLKTQLNESDVKEYFSKEFSVNEEEIEIINLQRCIEKQDKTTDYYVIQFIVQKNTTMIYYYNLKSDEYSKYLEYTSEYSNIYTLFNAKNANEEITTINNKTTNYICVPVDIDLIEDNDTYYRRIFNNLQNETTFNYFNQSYFEKGIENGSFYFLTAYGKQDNWGTRFDLTSHGFLVDNKGQKVYHWDTGGIG